MNFVNVHEGDILLYRRINTAAEAAIVFGEVLEDGIEDREYYHCAIALSSTQKVEALGEICVTNIVQDGSFDVFRVPLHPDDIRQGLHAALKLVGQKYDWWLIADDVLRYLTRGHVHLPKKFIESKERRMKICSSFVHYFFRRATRPKSSVYSVAVRGSILRRLKRWPPPSPQDLYLAVQEYEVD